MAIILSEKTEKRLTEFAASEGRDVNRAADDLVETALDLVSIPQVDTAEAIREAQQAFAEGRARPLSEYLEEVRKRYGVGDEWPDPNSVHEVFPGVFVPSE